MPQFAGGAPLPVTVSTAQPTEGGAATPVYVVSSGQAPLGQRARRVVVVTSGPVKGGAPFPFRTLALARCHRARHPCSCSS